MAPARAASDVAETLRPSIDSARAAWPEIRIPEEAFASYLLARSLALDDIEPAAPDSGRTFEGLHVADLYLACGCARGDPQALSTFDRRYLIPLEALPIPMVPGARVGAEVTQLVRQRLLVGDGARPPRIVEYGGRGTLAGWVRVVAMRAATDLHRSERSQGSLVAEGGLHPVPRPDSPEDAALWSRFGEAFNQAFRNAFRSLPDEDRLILRLHFAEGLNLDQLAELMGFSRATSGRRVLAGKVRLREETLRILQQELRAPREDIEGVINAFRSRLEVSISALVTTA